MPDDPAQLWRAYARMQAELADSHRADRDWGLEEGLNSILERLATGSTSEATPEKAVAAADRRERHRARLRRIHRPALEMGVPDSPARFDARVQLAEIRRVLPHSDWRLACHVALGTEYRQIAKNIGGSSGSLRIKMRRIRQSLRKLAA